MKTIIEKKFFDMLRFSKIYLVTPLVTPIKTTENNDITNQYVTYQIHFSPRHHLTERNPATNRWVLFYLLLLDLSYFPSHIPSQYALQDSISRTTNYRR
nr:MAG TPA: hypothetical protein [Caudoviricetes sp.]